MQLACQLHVQRGMHNNTPEPNPGTWWQSVADNTVVLCVAYVTHRATHFTDGSYVEHPWLDECWVPVPPADLAHKLADKTWQRWGHGPPSDNKVELVQNMMRALMTTLVEAGVVR